MPNAESKDEMTAATQTNGALQMESGEFHNRDGWYFKRQPDGAVRIRKTTTAHIDAPIEHEHTIPAEEWASIVAHVSANGETAETYQEAHAFHAGAALLRDVREFALLFARVYRDGSMLVKGRIGAIPAQSFAALYRAAPRVDEPSAFNGND